MQCIDFFILMFLFRFFYALKHLKQSEMVNWELFLTLFNLYTF